LDRAWALHRSSGAALTALTAVVPDAHGYGRILRTANGDLAAIVEQKDATADQQEIREINSGIYLLELAGLFDALRKITTQNAQREYYLTDLVEVLRQEGRRTAAFSVDDPTDILGINTLRELADMTRMMRQQKVEELMAAGVTIEDPDTTFIDLDVVVGADTVIRPGVYLEGQTTIGARCVLHSGVRIVNSALGDHVEVRNFCVIQSCRVADNVAIGPFAHLRPDSDVRDGAHVGNFVELKKTVLGPGSKANHLAYLGDATVGAGVNVGAGTITCNYDGERKHETRIGDGAFIGTNSSLVAPVQVGAGAYVAAGSTITQDVPDDSLAVARSRQVNKEGWVRTRVRKKPRA
jgi:bifunctional UDP-N-acetylglucosamine pyrophosphorylase/glucosamine-1-phosphate N-acetyltransferase